MIIGIAGGTGSGKTTLTERIQARFPNQIQVLYHDNYYKSYADLPYAERIKLNYDHPDAFDDELFVDHLMKLQHGEAVDMPIYDYTLYTRSPDTQRVEPTPVIIVEGILIYYDPQLRDLFDIKLFVDTDADVRILRRLKRDVIERGRTIESVEKQYLETVKPMHELYVEPTKRFADIIIPEGGHNLVALDMVTNRIASTLAGESEE